MKPGALQLDVDGVWCELDLYLALDMAKRELDRDLDVAKCELVETRGSRCGVSWPWRMSVIRKWN